MVNHVIDTLRKAEINDVNLIIGKGAELVNAKTEYRRKVTYSDYLKNTLKEWGYIYCSSCLIIYTRKFYIDDFKRK